MKQLLAIILVAAAVSSCSTSNLAHKPSSREIRRAMSYSTWEYAQPTVSMPKHSISPFKHAVIVQDK